MRSYNVPEKQGLYDPQFEHDACGMGFVVHMKGERSNDILRQSLQALKNLTHRGGVGSEPDTGDGAGILLQIPHRFFLKVCADQHIALPPPGQYGVGMVFLPIQKELRRQYEASLEEIIQAEGQQLLGWRDV